MTARGLIEWAGTMPVPSGDGAGEPWQVVAWQRKILSAVVRPDVQVIAASCGRANGKTALTALISRAFLPGGPLYERGARVVVVSSSHDRAREVVTDLEGWRQPGWLVANSHQVARVKAGGATVRALAANPKTCHGIRASLVVCDELAQWGQPDRLYAALRTSLGKRPGSKLLAVGTRPESGTGHVFDRLLSGDADVSLTYAATEADEKAGRLGWRRTWRRANPSLDVLPSLEATIRREWADAKKDDQALAMFKALRLNMGVSDTSENVLISTEAWARCEVDVLPPRTGPFVLGVDVGGSGALTAACAFWPASKRLEAFACVGGLPDLLARGRADNVGTLYRDMARRGELTVHEGLRVPDYAAFVGEAVTRWGAPAVICADRYKEAELRDALDAGRMRRGLPLVLRGMGWKNGGEDVRRFRRAVLREWVAAPRSLLIRSALSEARTVTDIAGTPKLAKSTQGGRRGLARDDVAAAMILAIAEADRRGVPGAGRGVRLVAI